jgi:hypothetical protein
MTAAMAVQLSASHIRPLFLMSAQFTDGTIYVWSGMGTLSWNGQTWIGLGTLGTISGVEESSEIKANNVTFTLSGIDPSLLGEALNQARQGYPVTLWFGFLDDQLNVVADPVQAYSGRMDVPVIEEGSDTSTISLTVENRLIDLNRTKERRYTDQDQQIDFPGDTGFRYVAALQNWNGVWGRASGTGTHQRPTITGNNPGSGLRSGGGRAVVPII